MSVARLVVAAALVVFVAVGPTACTGCAGCGGSESTSGTTRDGATSTMDAGTSGAFSTPGTSDVSVDTTDGGAHSSITAISLESDLCWTPPESPPKAEVAVMSAALGEYGMRTLLPSAPPVGYAGPLSARFWVTRTVPTDLVSAGLVIYPLGEGNPVLSVSTSRDDGWSSSYDWLEVEVRGITGRALMVEGAVSFLQWEERGQVFQVEFKDQDPLSFEQLIGWLDSWHLFP